MSVISPGNRAFKKSSCTRRTAFSRTAKSLARVVLPAAIFPHKKINFAGVLILVSHFLLKQKIQLKRIQLLGYGFLGVCDGVLEATNGAGQAFGEFRSSVIETNSELSADRFSHLLLDEIRSWPGPNRQFTRSDDITFLVIDFR